MGGVGHDFKAGVNYIHEPRLFITFNTGTNDYTYTHLDNDVNGPLSTRDPQRRRGGSQHPARISTRSTSRTTGASTSRLTLNLGLRYDLIDGIQIDQSLQPELREGPGRGPGRPSRRASRGWRTSVSIRRKTPTTGSRASASPIDLRGDGRDVIRGGWGIYTGHGVHELQRALPRHRCDRHRFGRRSSTWTTPTGIRNPDGSFYRVGQPISNIASQNQANPECAAAHRASGWIRGSRCRTRVRRRSAGRTSSAPARC